MSFRLTHLPGLLLLCSCGLDFIPAAFVILSPNDLSLPCWLRTVSHYYSRRCCACVLAPGYRLDALKVSSSFVQTRPIYSWANVSCHGQNCLRTQHQSTPHGVRFLLGLGPPPSHLWLLSGYQNIPGQMGLQWFGVVLVPIMWTLVGTRPMSTLISWKSY